MEEIRTTNIYTTWVNQLIKKVKIAQTQAIFKVNAELLQLYWEIGKSILLLQKQQSWGSQVVDNLAKDLKKRFSNNFGFSVRNLKYMRAFAKAYPDFPIVQVPLAQNNIKEVWK